MLPVGLNTNTKIMKLKSIILWVFCLLLVSMGNAQGDSIKLTPLEYQHALNNPLKGFRYSSVGSGNKYPYNTIIRQYIKWNEIERNAEDGLDRILEYSDQKWKEAAQNNMKVIPRVYLDWDSKPGNEYWPEDMVTGDYSSEQFIRRVKEMVDKLGKAWDNDSRIAWIQLGIIGYWGEHHHPKPTLEQQKLLGDLFTEAFQNKKVLVRYPAEQFNDYNFGMYWDRFGDTKPGVNQAVDFMELYPDRWKTVPNEGEVGYGADYGDANPGEDPDDSLLDPAHRRHLINWIRKLHATGCGWISNYSVNNPQVRAGADELQKVFGYRFILKEVTYPKSIQNNQSFTISFVVENVGSAPFYYNWPVEMRLLDPETHEVKWKQIFNELDIHDWMPGEQWNESLQKYDMPAPLVSNTSSFTIENPLPKGKYILALSILDPAGMVPSVKFASSQYFSGGNHPIGYIGIDTSIAQPILDPASFDDPATDNSLYYEVQSSYQSPYGGTNHAVPGLIEAEYYDEGGEGLAFHDDAMKEGDTGFRAEDNVDVISRAGSSNGSVVSFTEESEWLEYTADIVAGKYDITLYYYCGESPGELVLHIEDNIQDTISGFQNQGWEKRDSIIAEDVLVASGGKKKIIRLEFLNNAGFDIDALRFTRLLTPVSGVSLSGCPADTLPYGYYLQLNATVEPPYADDPEIHWESSNEQVATVDSQGIITSYKNGTTRISASTGDGSFTEECELSFYVPLVPVYGLTLGNCPDYVLKTGDIYQLLANVAPPNATDPSVTWSSSNPDVATIDSTGLLSALSQGTTKITLTANDGGHNATCNVGVMSTGIAVTGVTLNGCSAEAIAIDNTIPLTAGIVPANADDQRVEWSSSDESVALVDAQGSVTAVSMGVATIAVTTLDGGYMEECTVTIESTNVRYERISEDGIAKVYPNPAGELIYIRFTEPATEKRIKFYDIYGRVLASEKSGSSILMYPTQNLGSGGVLIIEAISSMGSNRYRVLYSNE